METKTSGQKEESLRLDTFMRMFHGVFKGLADEFLHSAVLKKEGLDTDTSTFAEQTMNRPIDAMLVLASRLNDDVSVALDQIVKMHFAQNKVLLSSVASAKDGSLNYFIVLKKDTDENRSKVNQFFDFYYMQDYSQYNPIDFHYTTAERFDRISQKEMIDLEGQQAS